jgi:Mpv17 / PMP22 family
MAFLSKHFQSNIRITNSVTGFLTFSAGDVLSQKLLHAESDISWERAAKTGALGILMNGVVLHNWYYALDAVFGNSMTSIKVVALKMIVDQVFYAPFSKAVFFCYASMIAPLDRSKNIEADDGDTSVSAISRITETFTTKMHPSFMAVFIADCCVWPFINYINFSHISRNFRPTFVGVAQLIWQTIVSSLCHSSESTDAKSADILCYRMPSQDLNDAQRE